MLGGLHKSYMHWVYTSVWQVRNLYRCLLLLVVAVVLLLLESPVHSKKRRESYCPNSFMSLRCGVEAGWGMGSRHAIPEGCPVEGSSFSHAGAGRTLPGVAETTSLALAHCLCLFSTLNWSLQGQFYTK